MWTPPHLFWTKQDIFDIYDIYRPNKHSVNRRKETTHDAAQIRWAAEVSESGRRSEPRRDPEPGRVVVRSKSMFFKLVFLFIATVQFWGVCSIRRRCENNLCSQDVPAVDHPPFVPVSWRIMSPVGRTCPRGLCFCIILARRAVLPPQPSA